MIHKFTKAFHFAHQFLSRKIYKAVYQLTLLKIKLVEFSVKFFIGW